jgi:hypothetical protein
VSPVLQVAHRQAILADPGAVARDFDTEVARPRAVDLETAISASDNCSRVPEGKEEVDPVGSPRPEHQSTTKRPEREEVEPATAGCDRQADRIRLERPGNVKRSHEFAMWTSSRKRRLVLFLMESFKIEELVQFLDLNGPEGVTNAVNHNRVVLQ